MTLLAVKLLLAPMFVVGASLTARRFGPRIGGLVGGLPVVAGPILLAYALAHGESLRRRRRRRHPARAGLTDRLRGRLRPPRRRPALGVCMLCGWLAFGIGTAIFSAFSISDGVALVLAALALLAGLRWLPLPPRAACPVEILRLGSAA